jgi:hypothetical protein
MRQEIERLGGAEPERPKSQTKAVNLCKIISFMNDSNIEIFTTEDGNTEVQVNFKDETVWLSQKQMALLFEKDSDTIGLHLKNIYKSGELEENSTTEEFSVIQQEGKRSINRNLKYYNLDAIISVGYKVNSKRGVLFRIWAN